MAAIDIRTAQNVTIEYELASLRERFLAFFLDLVIYYAIAFCLSYIIMLLFGGWMTRWGFMFWNTIIWFVGLMLYHFLSEILANGRTWGKRALGIKVVRLDGRVPGLGDYLLRSLFLIVDFFFSFGVLGAVLIGSTFNHQRFGDLAANTTVIRVKNKMHFRLEDILKIQSIENYEPQYPAVRQLKESDMIMIKNLIARYQTWRNEANADAVQRTVEKVCTELSIEAPPQNKLEFLKTLIRDYIVLTR